MLLNDIVWEDLDIDEVIANSYKDFHVKGFDYVCLHRDPGLTLKVYFFEDGIQDASEVVNPHDHRYDFWTECLSGTVRNKWFEEGVGPRGREGCVYTGFYWNTPLNGGSGFEYADDVMLHKTSHYAAGPGQRYFMCYDELHTIQILKPETCIVLAQYEDKVPIGMPTRTFVRDGDPVNPPEITGLYNRFTADQAVKRIQLARELHERRP